MVPLNGCQPIAVLQRRSPPQALAEPEQPGGSLQVPSADGLHGSLEPNGVEVQI
jgi:hypothetical protein